MNEFRIYDQTLPIEDENVDSARYPKNSVLAHLLDKPKTYAQVRQSCDNFGLSNTTKIDFNEGLKELMELEKVIQKANNEDEDDVDSSDAQTPTIYTNNEMKPNFERFGSMPSLVHQPVVRVSPMID